MKQARVYHHLGQLVGPCRHSRNSLCPFPVTIHPFLLKSNYCSDCYGNHFLAFLYINPWFTLSVFQLYKHGILLYISLYVWLLRLNILWDLSLLYVAVLYSFSLLNNIPLCKCTITLVMDISIVSNLGHYELHCDDHSCPVFRCIYRVRHK